MVSSFYTQFTVLCQLMDEETVDVWECRRK